MRDGGVLNSDHSITFEGGFESTTNALHITEGKAVACHADDSGGRLLDDVSRVSWVNDIRSILRTMTMTRYGTP